MARNIPVTVITGFLGAGKTSLVRHLASQAGNRRLAFMINEFGDLGIDREILLGCGVEGCTEDDVMELANGCICCTVADDFLPTMEKILKRPQPPEHILIETSGLALPKPLITAFNWPEVRTRATVDGVIAVVDGPSAVQLLADLDTRAAAGGPTAGNNEDVGHDDPLEEVFTDQLHCADLVLLNKTDLLTAEALSRLEEQLRTRLRPGVRLLPAAHGQVSPLAILGLDAAAEDDLAARPSLHDGLDGEHDHDDFESFTLSLGPVADADALQTALEAAAAEHGIIRVKGFLDRSGLARREVIQGVGPRFTRYFDRDWQPGEPRGSRLVIIGPAGLARTEICAALNGRVA